MFMHDDADQPVQSRQRKSVCQSISESGSQSVAQHTPEPSTAPKNASHRLQRALALQDLEEADASAIAAVFRG